jgi:outer membrane cobalamin receptor
MGGSGTPPAAPIWDFPRLRSLASGLDRAGTARRAGLTRRAFSLRWVFACAAASAFAAILLPIPAVRAQVGDITGSVVDAATGRPLPFANVGVVDTTLGANSGADGRFTIRSVAPGTYRLRASYIGYDPEELTVSVLADRVAEARFKLTKKAAAGVTEKVVVNAERPLVDVSEVSSVRQTTAEDIGRLAVDQVTDVVQRQVGVAGEGDQLHIRGGRSDETVIRIENVAMKNVVTGSSVGGTFSAKAVQSLQVITGGYEAEYGQAISGIVNVELKEGGDRRRSEVEYHSGSFDTERFFMQTEGPLLPLDGSYPIPGKMSYLFGVDMLATDTFLPSLREATNFDEGLRRTLHSGNTTSFAGMTINYDDFLRPRQANNINLYSKLTWRLSNSHRLHWTYTKFVGLDHGFNRYRVGDEVADAASTNTTYNWAFHDQLDQFPTYTEETSSSSIDWRWAIGTNAYSTFGISHFYNNQEEAVQGKHPWIPGQEYDEFRTTGQDTFFVSDANGDFPSYRDLYVDRYGLLGSYKHRWRAHHEFKAGVEANYYELQMVDIRNPREGEGGLGSVHDLYKVFPNDGAFYAQNQFSYEGFAGHVGLRADYLFLGKAADDAAAQQEAIAQDYLDSTHGLFGYRYKLFWSPRLALNYPITERDAMHFNFGHFIQWPRFIYYYSKISSRSSEAFPVEGNLNLDPERSVQFEFGLKHQFTDTDAVDVTLYNKDTYDYPTATRTLEATRQRLVYVNSDFSRTRGIEMVWQHQGGRRVSTQLSYEYQIATGKPPDPNRIKQVDPEALETGDAEPDLNEQYMPWNRPHRFQAGFDLRFHKGDRPHLFGWQMPDYWGLNFFYTLSSGKPYTPTDIRGQQTGERNSQNAPFESDLDMRFDKNWDVGRGTRLGLALEIRNLLDQAPLRVVDSNTGEVPRIGYGTHTLATPGLPRSVEADQLSNPAFYGEGRNIRFGLEVGF